MPVVNSNFKFFIKYDYLETGVCSKIAQTQPPARRRGGSLRLQLVRFLRRLNVAMVMQPQCTVIFDDTPLQEVIKKAADLEIADFIVTDHEAELP